MKKWGFIGLILTLAITSFVHQKQDLETREIILNNADTLHKIRILIKNPVFSPNQKKVYAWYQKQTLLETRGSWSGKLLHGRYEAFYPNNNLLSQGKYQNGYRIGIWQKWYPDGEIQEKVQWEDGLKHGYFEY